MGMMISGVDFSLARQITGRRLKRCVALLSRAVDSIIIKVFRIPSPLPSGGEKSCEIE